MEPRAFISQAILDIVGGIEDAQSKTAGGTIVPNYGFDLRDNIIYDVGSVQAVSFEVSVHAGEAKGGEGKISVVGSIIGVGASAKKSNKSGHSGVLKFLVPIQFPVSDFET